MVTTKLKVAIIGLGRMGAEPTSRFNGMLCNGWDPISHAEAIQSIDGLALTALCDVDINKCKKFCALYNVDKYYTNYKQLITEIKPDIISIATRSDIKAEIINYALASGVKGFYVEKPLGRSIAECETVLNNIKFANAKIVYGAQRRAMTVYQQVKNICNSGKYGSINGITFEYGKNLLLWSHPHTIDLIMFFTTMAELDYISAICDFTKKYESNEILIDEDPFIETAFIKFKNNIAVTITQNDGNNVRIHLTNAIITINGDGYSIDINTTDKIPRKFHQLDRIFAASNKSGTQLLFLDLEFAVRHSLNVTLILPNEILGGIIITSGIVQSALNNGAKVYASSIKNNLFITGKFNNLYP